jgi:ComF family protein
VFAERSSLVAFARRALDVLLPPVCLSCGVEVDAPGRLCAACWSRVTFLAPPFCACCGLPFDYDLGPGALCAACAAAPPRFGRARAVLRYDEHSRGLILRLKHADRLEGAGAFGAWMARAGAELLDPGTLVAPVPLHRWRLLRRRYNQAALLALHVARAAGEEVEAVTDLLARRRATPAQAGLGRAQRARNVQGAFVVRPHHEEIVRGRHVVLVDDVLTTGATLEACARPLLRAGAARVDALVLARVVRDEVAG